MVVALAEAVLETNSRTIMKSNVCMAWDLVQIIIYPFASSGWECTATNREFPKCIPINKPVSLNLTLT